MPYALIFPGQGAQEVGMGRDFYDQHDSARDVFKEADEALGFSLTRLIFEGPEEDLMKTAITQPAVMTMSIAVMRVFEKEYGEKLNPLFVAGHSLGEYTALIAAGALPFAEGVSLVHKRGQWMQEAVPLGMGAMAAIMGLDMDTLKDVCEQAAEGEVCQPANVNAPTQIVISGHTAAVGRTMETAKAIGASKVIPLKVSAPFHSDLMKPVAEKLLALFESLSWKEPLWPIMTNVDAQPLTDISKIKNALYRQTFSPVLWVSDAQAMESAGVDTFIELGPGNVLSGLTKRICKGKKVCPIQKVTDIPKGLETLRGDLE